MTKSNDCKSSRVRTREMLGGMSELSCYYRAEYKQRGIHKLIFRNWHERKRDCQILCCNHENIHICSVFKIRSQYRFQMLNKDVKRKRQQRSNLVRLFSVTVRCILCKHSVMFITTDLYVCKYEKMNRKITSSPVLIVVPR